MEPITTVWVVEQWSCIPEIWIQLLSFFGPQGDQLDPRYILLYYYYGGMVFTCLHDYLQALLFFTVVCNSLHIEPPWEVYYIETLSLHGKYTILKH